MTIDNKNSKTQEMVSPKWVKPELILLDSHKDAEGKVSAFTAETGMTVSGGNPIGIS